MPSAARAPLRPRSRLLVFDGELAERLAAARGSWSSQDSSERRRITQRPTALSHLSLRVRYGIRATGASPRTGPTASAVGSDPHARSRRCGQP